MIDRFQEWLFPELRRFDSRVSGRYALRIAHWESLRSRRVIVFAVFTAVAVIATKLFIKHALAPRFPLEDYASEWIFYIALLIFLAFHSRESRKPLRRYLRMEGVPICVACGYDTTGIGQAMCPECGASLGESNND
ncbi:MAG: hypothetical protein H6813_02290 [Phycisphaeraceae bacterium]|nr:hypothetical protein [Phycisphaeraceae bacterium]MCB9848853.1 hypothetical protein [Phycisphaeraceae bacterium]